MSQVNNMQVLDVVHAFALFQELVKSLPTKMLKSTSHTLTPRLVIVQPFAVINPKVHTTFSLTL